MTVAQAIKDWLYNFPKLNIDEKLSGRCYSCGTTFESSLPNVNKQYNYSNHINKCPNCGKILSEDESLNSLHPI